MKKILILIGCAIALYWLIGHKWLMVDWDDIEIHGVRKQDQLELATRGLLIKNSSLRLICSEKGEVRLVLYTVLPMPDEFKPGSGSFLEMGRFSAFKDRTYEEIKAADETALPATLWTVVDAIDVLATPPLTIEQLDVLAKAFNRPSPFMLTYQIAETNTWLDQSADGVSVASFGKHCLKTELPTSPAT